MSLYFSKFLLNTYGGSPYFTSQIPADFPLSIMLQRARAFRRLPPNIKTLAALSKRWTLHKQKYLFPQIDEWYDDAGNELDPDTGLPLTDSEIDAQWGNAPPERVDDIPYPPGGFADPDSWEEPKVERPPADGPTRLQLTWDVYARGRKRVALDYGISEDLLPWTGSSDDGTDFETTRRHFSRRANRVLHSPWFQGRPEELAFLKSALACADLYDDLAGRALIIFNLAEDEELRCQQDALAEGHRA